MGMPTCGTLYVLVVVTVAMVEAQRDWWRTPNLQAGSACKLNDGGQGICRPLSQCLSHVHKWNSYHHNTRNLCNSGTSTPVVCCRVASRGPSPENSAQIHWQQWGSRPPFRQSHPGYWNQHPTPSTALPSSAPPTTTSTALPCSAPPTPPSTALPCSAPPTTPSTALPPSAPPTISHVTPKMMAAITNIGYKSTRACKEYSEEVSKIVFPLIFNGKNVKPGEFPHMALLGYQPKGQTNISWNCGGTLISRRYVITAAHCFSNSMLRAPVRVRLGEYDLQDDDDNAVDYGIKRWQVHPDYRGRSWYQDLALIELDRKVKFTRYIQPACLWTNPQDPGTGLIITGWGSTQQDGSINNILQKGNGTLNRVEPNICMEFFKTATLQLRDGIQDGILCARDDVGSVDTCKGDSGGPVQVESDVEVAYYVVAVVSGGSLCGSRVPSVNMRIYTYLDWIEREVWPDNTSLLVD